MVPRLRLDEARGTLTATDLPPYSALVGRPRPAGASWELALGIAFAGVGSLLIPCALGKILLLVDEIRRSGVAGDQHRNCDGLIERGSGKLLCVAICSFFSWQPMEQEKSWEDSFNAEMWRPWPLM
jgi:hypothetical protein